MSDEEKIIKHLEMIQGVVSRMAQNSFLIKGWGMAIIAAALIFISRLEAQSPYLILSFLIPVLGFWFLDGYFLSQERAFRGVYNKVRKQNDTDFDMGVPVQTKRPWINQLSAMFSQTLVVFYLIEVGFVVAVFLVLRCLWRA